MVILRTYEVLKRKCIISKSHKTQNPFFLKKLMVNDLESMLHGWMSSMFSNFQF